MMKQVMMPVDVEWLLDRRLATPYKLMWGGGYRLTKLTATLYNMTAAMLLLSKNPMDPI